MNENTHCSLYKIKYERREKGEKPNEKCFLKVILLSKQADFQDSQMLMLIFVKVA